MKVRDVIRKLETMAPDDDVRLVYEYGDRQQTLVADPIRWIEEGEIGDSNYFQMRVVIDPEGDDYDDNGLTNRRPVVLLFATKG